jgi:peroxiredoxin
MKQLFILIALIASPAFAAVQTNQPAPDFTLPSANGESVKLSDYAGKNVVLEWTNHGCPFVKKFYESGAMQKQQKATTENGAVWLRIISSAPGKQGHLSAQEAKAQIVEQSVSATHTLLDKSGDVGRLYGAKTTPHMYVINTEGTLVYQGAIDDKAGVDPTEINDATNYVDAALEAIAQGKTPEVQETKSYGCGVKY